MAAAPPTPAYTPPVVNRFGIAEPAAPASYGMPAAAAPAYPAYLGIPPVATPVGWQPVPSPPDSHGGLRRTGPLVLAGIGFGALMQVVMLVLGHNGRTEPATLIRYALVGTVGLYLAVTVLLVLHLARTGERLRWTTGSPALGAITGILTGGSLALAMLAVVKLVTGTASGDPRIAMLVSEGSADHIVTAVLIAVVAAPLVEEILFRGVLAESLRSRGAGAAIMLSAAAFSAWHLNPSALRYYVVMGAMLGGLYWKRGLVSSMAAHATFNGLLTLAAVLSVTAPGHLVQAGDLTLRLPSGWHESTATAQQVGGADATFLGPSGSFLAVMHQQTPARLDGDTMARRLLTMSQGGPYGAIRPGSIREEHLPAGVVARADIEVDGHRGSVVLLPQGSTLYVLVVATAGSTKAAADFERILRSVAPS